MAAPRPSPAELHRLPSPPPEPPPVSPQSRRHASGPSPIPPPLGAALCSTSITAVAQFLALFNSTIQPDVAAINAVLRDAHATGSEQLSVQAAQAWGNNFQFPPSAHSADAAELTAAGGSFCRFAAQRQKALAATRLSLDRVFRVLGPDGLHVPAIDPADFTRLCTLAGDGIRIPTPPTFVRCANPPPLRAKYVQVAAAVNRLIYDQYRAGTVALLPLHVAQTIPGVHFSSQHWTEKKGKAQGRIICDVANADDPATSPLNGRPGPERDTLRTDLEAQWGQIRHPTLPALMHMVLRATEQYGWEEVVLWKKDLQGAFNLLWFRPADAHLLAFLLTSQLVVLHLAGMFGWVGMPFVFDVVTRCLRAIVRSVIRGHADMYVDDLMAISRRSDLTSDMAAADSSIRALLGPHAVAPSKDESGRTLDWIGWSIDLDTRLVSLSHRNYLRTVYAFFFVDVTAPISLNHVQRMASLASRCSTLTRQMRPFTKALYDCAAMYSNGHQLRRLSALARADVEMWRWFLLAVHLDPARIARPIASFANRETDLLIQYDSSLSAFAVGVSTVRGDSVSLLAFATVRSPFARTTDSRYQNTYEYLAVVLGLLLVHRAGIRCCAYSLHGDSVSSLQWASQDRAASTLARRANIAFTTIACEVDALVADTVHVPGVANTVYDGLSRGLSAHAVGLDPTKEVELPAEHPIYRYISLCDPTTPILTSTDHINLAAEFLRLLSDPALRL